MLKLLVLFLLATRAAASVAKTNPCDYKNGGCEDICLWPGEGSHSCACNCPETLDDNGFNCSITIVCDVDIYVVIDVGLGVDSAPFCSDNASTIFLEYRDAIAAVLSEFTTLDVDRYRFGVQTLTTPSDFQNLGSGTTNLVAQPREKQSWRFMFDKVLRNLLRFGRSTLSSVISTFASSLYFPVCVSVPEYFQQLALVVPENPAIGGFMSLSPGSYRNGASTTRIAIAFSSGRTIGFNPANTESILEAPKAFFDDILVVFPVDADPVLRDVSRRLACGNKTVPCDKLFQLYSENEFGQNLTRATIDDVVDYQACLNRFVDEPTVTCSSRPTLEIPICRLKGLTFDQLQFFNSSCDVSDFVSGTTTSYIFTLSPNRCGAVVVNGAFSQQLMTRTIHPLQDLPELNFTATCPLFFNRNPCAENNGGCSHHCIWFSGSPHYCTCPCGLMLDKNGYRCELQDPCSVDLYIGVDVGGGEDINHCFSAPPRPNFSLPFISYRDPVHEFLTNFIFREGEGRWRIGLQLFWEDNATLNSDTFESENLIAALEFLDNTDAPFCQPDFFPNYQYRLSRIVPDNPAVTEGYINEAPGTYGSPENTTYIALIVTTGGYHPIGLNEAKKILNATHEFFDDVVVVKLTDGTDDFDRLSACNNKAASCPKIFHINSANEFGKMLSIENFDDVVDVTGCASRRSTMMAETNVGCTPEISIDIPTCALLELTLEYLQFNDPSCDLLDYVTPTATGFRITVPSFKCGAQSEEVNGNYIVTQSIFSRDLGNLSSIPFVRFPIRCSYPVHVPVPDNVFVGESDATNDQVDFYASLNSNMRPRLENSACVEVNCPVYFKIDTALADPYSVALDTCYATNSPNPNALPRYEIADGGCPVDETFSLLPPPTNTSVCFTFDMFEWGATINVKEDDKLPVYIHCTLFSCIPEAPCSTPSCSGDSDGRRRRSVHEDDLLSTTFGPFYVMHPEKGEDEKEERDTVYVVEVPVTEKYGRKLFYQSCWLFVAVVITIFVVKKLMNKFVEDNQSGQVDFQPKILKRKQIL